MQPARHDQARLAAILVGEHRPPGTPAHECKSLGQIAQRWGDELMRVCEQKDGRAHRRLALLGGSRPAVLKVAGFGLQLLIRRPPAKGGRRFEINLYTANLSGKPVDPKAGLMQLNVEDES